jgi:hypothetical protein
MCEQGELRGAYKFRGREWRIPLASVLAYETAEREKTEDVGPGPGVQAIRRRTIGGKVDLRGLARGERAS